MGSSMAALQSAVVPPPDDSDLLSCAIQGDRERDDERPRPSYNMNSISLRQSSGHMGGGSLSSNRTSGCAGVSAGISAVSSDIGETTIDLQNLLRDNHIEKEDANNPFAFLPKQLGKLHDPKNLNVLRAMGGISGLCLGLRTDIKAGLPSDEDRLEGKITLQDIWHEVETRKKQDILREKMEEREGTVDNSALPPGFVRFDPAETRIGSIGLVRQLRDVTSTNLQDSANRFFDRRTIFSENKIPSRELKTAIRCILAVMCDKALVLWPVVV